MPLSQAAEAHRLTETGEVPGKIVLDPTLDKSERLSRPARQRLARSRRPGAKSEP